MAIGDKINKLLGRQTKQEKELVELCKWWNSGKEYPFKIWRE